MKEQVRTLQSRARDLHARINELESLLAQARAQPSTPVYVTTDSVKRGDPVAIVPNGDMDSLDRAFQAGKQQASDAAQALLEKTRQEAHEAGYRACLQLIVGLRVQDGRVKAAPAPVPITIGQRRDIAWGRGRAVVSVCEPYASGRFWDVFVLERSDRDAPGAAATATSENLEAGRVMRHGEMPEGVPQPAHWAVEPGQVREITWGRARATVEVLQRRAGDLWEVLILEVGGQSVRHAGDAQITCATQETLERGDLCGNTRAGASALFVGDIDGPEHVGPAVRVEQKG